jgi:hypothetical protein
MFGIIWNLLNMLFSILTLYILFIYYLNILFIVISNTKKEEQIIYAHWYFIKYSHPP